MVQRSAANQPRTPGCVVADREPPPGQARVGPGSEEIRADTETRHDTKRRLLDAGPRKYLVAELAQPFKRQREGNENKCVLNQ